MLPHRLADNLLGGFPFFGGVLALMVGVLAVGSDYGWDTLKTLLIQRPGRMRVFGAKVAAVAVTLVPFVVASFIAGAVASYLIAGAENAAVHWPSMLELVRGVTAGWFILATWAAFGVLLAVASRGTALAIGLGILYALVVEGLLSALASQVGSDARRVLPAGQRLLVGVGDQGPNGNPPRQRSWFLLRSVRGGGPGDPGHVRVRRGLPGSVRRAAPP